MPRSLLARSMEPLVAISWGIFLVWSVWLAVVWVLGINQQWLGLPIASTAGWDPSVAGMVQDGPPPRHVELRRAALLLADHAELAWFALALIQLHLHVIGTSGVNTARLWIGVAAGGAFLLGAANAAFGFPFGWMHFSRVLGAQILGVPLGWVLLWAVLLIGAREAVLRLWQRASHVAVTGAAAVVVLLTIANLHPIARDTRAWWFWHSGSVRQGAPTPWWFWFAWFLAAWGLLLMMREKSVVSGAAHRSSKPLVVVVLLNVVAVATHVFR